MAFLNDVIVDDEEEELEEEQWFDNNCLWNIKQL